MFSVGCCTSKWESFSSAFTRISRRERMRGIQDGRKFTQMHADSIQLVSCQRRFSTFFEFNRATPMVVSRQIRYCLRVLWRTRLLRAASRLLSTLRRTSRVVASTKVSMRHAGVRTLQPSDDSLGERRYLGLRFIGRQSIQSNHNHPASFSHPEAREPLDSREERVIANP